MNKNFLKGLAVLILSGLSSVTSAQEVVAAQPTYQKPAVVTVELTRKIDTLTDTVTFLQNELANCRNGMASSTSTPAQRTITTNTQAEASPEKPAEEVEETSCPNRQTVPPTARRGYQAASERLGCEDYSRSYFLRHPSMATVCGVDTSVPETETQATANIQVVTPTIAVSGSLPRKVSQTLPSAVSPR